MEVYTPTTKDVNTYVLQLQIVQGCSLSSLIACNIWRTDYEHQYIHSSSGWYINNTWFCSSMHSRSDEYKHSKWVNYNPCFSRRRKARKNTERKKERKKEKITHNKFVDFIYFVSFFLFFLFLLVIFFFILIHTFSRFVNMNTVNIILYHAIISDISANWHRLAQHVARTWRLEWHSLHSS